MTDFAGIVISGETDDFTLNMKQYENGFQISVTGGGTLAISTQEEGNVAFTTQTSISDESLIFDLFGVNVVRLTASVANVPFVLTVRREFTSSPTDNWDQFPRGGG